MCCGVQRYVRACAAESCSDKVFMESCLGTLQTELELNVYAGRQEAVRALSEYVRYCDRDRHHSSPGYVSPLEFEEQLTVPVQAPPVSRRPEAP